MNTDKHISCEPVIAVGIMTAREISVTFIEGFGQRDGTTCRFTAADGPQIINPEVPLSDSRYDVHDVCIGINFHWQQTETQRFAGALRLQPASDDASMITLVNMVPLESYLLSVISSEMSATSSPALLRAHAIISRSWLLFQIYGDTYGAGCVHNSVADDACDTPARLIRWYDHEAHTDFDVCADDHCQRYQGVTRMTSANVAQAVADTRGIVLEYDGEICDARFSKCCGGVTELFSSCWQPVDKPYLQVVGDNPGGLLFDDAESFIMSSPDSFCNVGDTPEGRRALRQVLNSYDRDTPDFYRWRVVYTPDRLRQIIKDKTGTDYGDIEALEVISRGPSARISELRIVGSLYTRSIGKELEIRRTLSPSHLYSSAFVVSRDDDGNWVLDGAGWGHGVGLCQIGAAMMAERGYSHEEILGHYFPGAETVRLY